MQTIASRIPPIISRITSSISIRLIGNISVQLGFQILLELLVCSIHLVREILGRRIQQDVEQLAVNMEPVPVVHQAIEDVPVSMTLHSSCPVNYPPPKGGELLVLPSTPSLA